MTTGWAHQHIRKNNRRHFGGRWQDRIPLRFPDPKHGETLDQYTRRIGYGKQRGELARLCKRSGGDRIWRDEEDLRAWFSEIGYISPWKMAWVDLRTLKVIGFSPITSGDRLLLVESELHAIRLGYHPTIKQGV